MSRLPTGFTRRPDGLLEYRFAFAESRQSVYGRSVKECLAKAEEKREKLKQGLRADNDKITFDQYADEWLQLKAHTVQESTLINYEVNVRRVQPFLGKIRMSQISHRDIVTIQARLSRSYSTTMTNGTIRTLRMIFKSAVLDRVITYNPCDNVKPLKRTEPPANKTIHRALTVEEQVKFLAAARENKSYYYELFLFLLQTGMRCGEAIALTWADIDYRSNVIRVDKTVTRTHNGFIVGDSPKTESSNREIPLTPAIKDTLSAQRQKMIMAHGLQNVKKTDRVFLQRRKPERLCSVQMINACIDKSIKTAGIDHFSVHAFRDTFATRAIEQSMPPNTLKVILGHSSITMTMDLYAQVQDSEKQKSMNALQIVTA